MYSKPKSGFTLIEILISLVLVGLLILITSSLILPLRLTRSSNIETQAVAFGQSYIELIKSRWQVQSNFIAGEALLPKASSSPSPAPEILLPAGWTLVVDGASSWTTNDTIRIVKVIVKPIGTTKISEWIVITTKITRPSAAS